MTRYFLAIARGEGVGPVPHPTRWRISSALCLGRPKYVPLSSKIKDYDKKLG